MTDKIAYIREAECIGCIKCIKACSDNAILGARKQMHTIITDLCTGCEDCIAVCPVDCIEMITKPGHQVVASLLPPKNTAVINPYLQAESSLQAKKDLIAEAIARTKAKRAWSQGTAHDTPEMPRDLSPL